MLTASEDDVLDGLGIAARKSGLFTASELTAAAIARTEVLKGLCPLSR